MIKKREKYLTFVTIFFITLSITNAITDVAPQDANLQIIGFSEKISTAERHEIFINESEFYKNRKRTFEVGLPVNSFVPQPRKGIDSINYFKSLNLADDNIYTLMQFETLDGDPTREQMDLLANDNVTLFEYHGDHTYYARIPKAVLETKFYDFVRWIGFIENGRDKIDIDTNLLNLTQGKLINVSIFFYEKINEEQLGKIINYSNTVIGIGDTGDDEPVIIQIDKSNIDKLSSLNFVKKIEFYAKPTLALDRSARVIATDYVWDYPNDGFGVTVGVIDTGIQRSHKYFETSTIFYAHDYSDDDNVSEAGCGESNCSDDADNDGDGSIDEGTHGVHVAGIISGQGMFNNRLIKGVSYDATLVIQRTFNSNNIWVAPEANLSDIWKNILDPDNDGNYDEPSSADVISNSWGISSSIYDGKYISHSIQVDRTVRGDNGKKVPVVFAAGNDGQGAFPKVNPPSTAKNVITVGASADFFNNTKCMTRYYDTNGDGTYETPDVDCYNVSALNVMDYSSRRTDDSRVKPDILAPGTAITSTVINDSYNSYDGTSMATPHVSAVAAQLLKQYNLTPYAVKAFLLSGTVNGSRTNNYPNNFDYNQGWGRLDAYRTIFKLSDEYTDSYDTYHIGEPGSGFSTDVYYNINVPSAADRLIVTLVWDDLPGDASGNNSKTLYNDVDLYFRYPNGSIDYSTKEDDNKNNVEKYIFNDPVNGIWEAHVGVIDLNGTAGTQNYSIKYQIERETTMPQIIATLNLNQTMIKPNAYAAVSTRVNANGNMFYDIDADLDVSGGLTITSSSFDGTDGDKDKVGDIPAGSNRYTRNWTVRGDSVGSRTVTANVNGFRIDGVGYSDSDAATLTVCNDDDNDGYFLNSCGGNDCNDNNANVNPDASEICDGVDNNCNGIVDEVCTPLGLTILYPINNAQYQTNTTDLNWTANNTLASCYYKLDESNYSNAICRANYSYSGFSFSVASQDTSPEDITIKGNNFYVLGRTDGVVFEYDLSGTYTGTSFSVYSQDNSPQGLTWNGSNFYVAGGATDSVYEYNPSGTYTGFSFSVTNQDTDPTAITHKDGSFFVLGGATQRVYQYNPAGTYMGFNFAVSSQDTVPEGIVWDGISFYVIGQGTDRVYEYYPTGIYTGFNFSVKGQETDPKGVTTNGSSLFVVGAITDKVYKYNSLEANLSNTTLSSLSIGKHNVTIYGKGSDGNTAQVNYTYFNITAPDTIPPSYSNLKTNPTSPATYQKNQQYQFNATWQDNVAVSTALIEFNGINYTMSQNVNEYYRTFTDLATGSYNYYFWANDTSGNSNKTDSLTYIINKAQSSTSLAFDKTSPQTYGASITPTCSVAVGVGITVLTMNGTTITSGNPLILGAGTYQFNCSLAESQNYTSSQNISAFVINQAVPNLTYYLNGLTQNITLQYPQKINASAYTTGGIINIFRNGTSITSENSINVTLAVGYYQYEFNVTGNQNYTDISSKFLFANINKGASIVYTYVNNSRSNITINAGASIYLNGTLITGEGPIQLYNNGTLINSGQSPLSNLTAFNNAGLYNITTIYPETQNYTSSFETWRVNATQVLTDIDKYLIKDNLGNNIAWFGDAGNIVIKGKLEQNSNFQATDNFAFKIRNNLNDVLIIENNGSMYIKGTLSENQDTIPINMERNEFRFKWNGEFKTNINESGYLFTKGSLTENGNP